MPLHRAHLIRQHLIFFASQKPKMNAKEQRKVIEKSDPNKTSDML